MASIHIIGFHDDADGFASAAAIETAMFAPATAANFGVYPIERVFYAVQYNTENNEFWNAMKMAHNQGLEIHAYLVDFSMAQADMDRIAAMSKHFTWIDHHFGVRAMLPMWSAGKVPENVTAVFNDTNKHSACVMAWEHFTGYVPDAVRYISDRDVWNFTMADSKIINLGLRAEMKGFRRQGLETHQDVLMRLCYDCNFMKKFYNYRDEFYATGRVIWDYLQATAENSVRGMFDLRFADYCVRGVFVTGFGEDMSEIGNIISENIKAPVAVVFPRASRVWQVSFRSIPGQAHTALDLAKALVGGGQIHAAGATIAWERFQPNPDSKGFIIT